MARWRKPAPYEASPRRKVEKQIRFVRFSVHDAAPEPAGSSCDARLAPTAVVRSLEDVLSCVKFVEARMRPSLSRVGAIRFCSVELGCVRLFGPDPRWHLTATLARPPVGATTFGKMRDEPPRPSDQDFADDEEAAHYNCEKEQELLPSVRIVLVLRSGRTVRKAGHPRCMEEVREWPNPPPSRKGAAKCVCIPTRERCAGCWKNTRR